MSRFELKRGDDLELVADVEQLRLMARRGQLSRSAQVRKDAGPWVRAERLPELKGAFEVDIWDAWDDMDEVEEAPLVAPPPRSPRALPPGADAETDPPLDDRRSPPPPELDSIAPEALEPLDVAPRRQVVTMRPRRGRAADTKLQVSVDELPEVEVEPLEPLSEGRRMGEVIAFPGAPSPSAPEAAPPPRRPLPLPPAKALPKAKADVGPPVPLRWFVLGAVVLFAAFVIWIQVDYIRSLATWTAAPPPEEPSLQPLVSGPDDPGVVEVTENPTTTERGPSERQASGGEVSETANLVRELRARLPGGALEVNGDADALSDAMFVDLQRVASVRTAKAEVLSWTGPNAGLPFLVRIQLAVNASDDPLADLAAAGLVAGKYVTLLDLKVQSLEVSLVDEDGGVRSRNLSGERAAELFQGRATLEAFVLPQD